MSRMFSLVSIMLGLYCLFGCGASTQTGAPTTPPPAEPPVAEDELVAALEQVAERYFTTMEQLRQARPFNRCCPPPEPSTDDVESLSRWLDEGLDAGGEIARALQANGLGEIASELQTALNEQEQQLEEILEQQDQERAEMEADLEEVAAHGEGGADTTIDELWADLVGAHAIQIGTELQTFEMTLGEHVVSAIMAAAEEAEVAAEAAGGAEAAPAELATRLRRLRCLDVRMSTFQFWDAIAMTLDGRCEGFGRPNAGSATPEEDCAAYRAAVEVREAWRRGAPEALSLAQRAAPLLETIGEEPPSEVVFEDITDLCPHFEPETSSAD